MYVKCLDYNLKFHIITKPVIINVQNSPYTFCKYLCTKLMSLAPVLFFYRHQIKNKDVFMRLLFLYFTSSKRFLVKICVLFMVHYIQFRFAEQKLLVVSVSFGLTCLRVGRFSINDPGNRRQIKNTKVTSSWFFLSTMHI